MRRKSTRNPRERISPVLLRDVKRAEAIYAADLARWGAHNLQTQRAEILWRELVARYEKQTGKPLYRVKSNPRRGRRPGRPGAGQRLKHPTSRKRRPAAMHVIGRALNPIRHGYTVLANGAELATFKTKYHALEYGRAYARARPKVRVQLRMPG